MTITIFKDKAMTSNRDAKFAYTPRHLEETVDTTPRHPSEYLTPTSTLWYIQNNRPDKMDEATWYRECILNVLETLHMWKAGMSIPTALTAIMVTQEENEQFKELYRALIDLQTARVDEDPIDCIIALDTLQEIISNLTTTFDDQAIVEGQTEGPTDVTE